MARAVALLTAGLAVRQVAEHLSIHPTGLRRLLHSHVGLGPKALQGVTRFQRFVASLGRLAGARTTLAALAAELGYADQAHLSREVRRLAGASPGSVLETFKTARDGGATVGAWRSSTYPSGSTTSTPTATCEAPRT